MKTTLQIVVHVMSLILIGQGCGDGGGGFQPVDTADEKQGEDDTNRVVDTGTESTADSDLDDLEDTADEADSGSDTDIDTGQQADSMGESDTDTAGLQDSETESDTVEDSDIEVPGDTEPEEETDSEMIAPRTAFFLVDGAGLGGGGSGCDLNNDGRLDNNLGGMVNDFIALGILDGDPSSEIQDSIQSGQVLIVLGLSEVHSFQNDSHLILEEYGAMIEGFNPGKEPPPEDLFSGYGTVILNDEPSSRFDHSSIVDRWLQTPDGPMIVPISIAGDVVHVELATGRVQANLGDIPDEEMLGGRLDTGLICGGVEKKYLIDLLIEKAKLKDPLSQAVARAAVGGRVDLKCGADDCISVAVVFSAVSVGVE